MDTLEWPSQSAPLPPPPPPHAEFSNYLVIDDSQEAPLLLPRSSVGWASRSMWSMLPTLESFNLATITSNLRCAHVREENLVANITSKKMSHLSDFFDALMNPQPLECKGRFASSRDTGAESALQFEAVRRSLFAIEQYRRAGAVCKYAPSYLRNFSTWRCLFKPQILQLE